MTDANTRAARDNEEHDRFERVRADPAKRRRGYRLLIWFAVIVFVVTLVDMVALDNLLQYGLLAAYALLFLIGIILLFTTRRADRAKRTEAATSSRVDLRCQHCGSVFHADMDHTIAHREAALSCPVCGIYSTLPGPQDVPVDVPVGGRPSKATPYVCVNCNERVVIGTFANAPHHQVLWKGCPHCGHAGAPRLATQPRPGDAEAKAAVDAKAAKADAKAQAKAAKAEEKALAKQAKADAKAAKAGASDTADA